MVPTLSMLVETRMNRVLEQLTSNESQCGAIAFLRDVKPILQNGPQCGLVALQMAANSFGLPSIDIQHIYRLAKERGFTNRGEMFSVDWLCELAMLIWPELQGSVEYMPTPERLTALLREQCAILVPYDCDKNNEPINSDGNTAHWCIVVGYLCPDQSLSEVIWSTQEPISYDNMHIFCLHGKSRHLAVWKYANLVESNANLNEIGDKRMTDGEMYILPADGVAALKCKCLILHL